MRLGRATAVVLAMLALSAVVAGNASATATTTAAKFFKGTSELDEPETVKTKITLGEHKLADGTTKALVEFTTRVSGQSVDLTATGAECISCTIENAGVPVGAKGHGVINFTGVTVMEPPNCVVKGEHVESVALKAEADYMEGTKAVVKFVPSSGSTFATIILQNSPGGTCPIATGSVVAGEVYGEALNTTGTGATRQDITLDPALNETFSGKTAALHVGTEVAKLYGRVGFELASGASYNVH